MAYGPEIGPDGTDAERSDFGQDVLERLQRDVLLAKVISDKLEVFQMRQKRND